MARRKRARSPERKQPPPKKPQTTPPGTAPDTPLPGRSLDFSEENLRKAYCQALTQTGIGAAATNCEQLLPELVWKVVPQAMQATFPERLLASVERVCTQEPFYWSVIHRQPLIRQNSTFRSVLEGWFSDILFEE